MLQLVGQTYIAVVGDNTKDASTTSLAEVRMIGGKVWTADVKITAATVGTHDTKRKAAKAAAQHLRDLAEQLESSD